MFGNMFGAWARVLCMEHLIGIALAAAGEVEGVLCVIAAYVCGSLQKLGMTCAVQLTFCISFQWKALVEARVFVTRRNRANVAQVWRRVFGACVAKYL